MSACKLSTSSSIFLTPIVGICKRTSGYVEKDEDGNTALKGVLESVVDVPGEDAVPEPGAPLVGAGGGDPVVAGPESFAAGCFGGGFPAGGVVPGGGAPPVG
jgi:hypothetical protein